MWAGLRAAPRRLHHADGSRSRFGGAGADCVLPTPRRRARMAQQRGRHRIALRTWTVGARRAVRRPRALRSARRAARRRRWPLRHHSRDAGARRGHQRLARAQFLPRDRRQRDRARRDRRTGRCGGHHHRQRRERRGRRHPSPAGQRMQGRQRPGRHPGDGRRGHPPARAGAPRTRCGRCACARVATRRTHLLRRAGLPRAVAGGSSSPYAPGCRRLRAYEPGRR